MSRMQFYDSTGKPALGLRALTLLTLYAVSSCTSYKIPISDTDDVQACSGMWAGPSTYINVTFQSSSKGQVSAAIYEWSDVELLGKAASDENDIIPKTYICTSDAVRNNICDETHLGEFIIDLPSGKRLNDTSFWTARVGFSGSLGSNSSQPVTLSAPGLWDNPAGNPALPDTDTVGIINILKKQNQPSNDILWYSSPIHYEVHQNGYYCVVVVPVSVLSSDAPARQTDNATFHSTFTGEILFQNVFQGRLPATDYPKIQLYLALLLTYSTGGIIWGFLCWRYRDELLPIQYYLSSLIGFLIIEMLASWAYYRYLNTHGTGPVATAFLFVVAILDAGRNSLSLFLLLVVSLGLSVVTESLGPLMVRCWLLAVAHFIFGVLYAVGIVELQLESTSALVLLLFIVPLAFTLSGFLSWIMYALNGTITRLQARKQHYKLRMFRKLHYNLMGTVVAIAVFFVVSSVSFSNRFQQNYAADTWATRWWLLDGWLAILYLIVFSSIAWIWRPSDNNRRLAMSDELAQDESDVADYDLDNLEAHQRDDDDATLVGDRRQHIALPTDEVVFEIGEDEFHESDDDSTKKPHSKLSPTYDETQPLSQ